MNSFDSVLLCNDITSCDGTEQNRTREQQIYVLIRIQAKQQQHGRFRLVQIQWNCTFNIYIYAQENESKKMETPRRKDASESYVYRQQINISQFEIRSVTQLLAFQCGQGVVSGSHYRYSKMKQEKNKWVIFLTYHILQHKFELRIIIRRSYNDFLIID